MKFILIVWGVMLCLVSCANKNVPLYVGTFTDGQSEGIYRILFDMETGKLSNLQLVAKTEDPSFIAYSPNRKQLYAVNAIDSGTVSSFRVENNDSLTLINKVSSNGAGPCHISINKIGTMAAVSTYRGGTVSLHSILKDGSLSEAFQVFDHNSENEVSHAHSAQFFDDELFVADLGRNAVYNYRLTKDKTKYELVTPSIIEMLDNSGPRHFTLTNNGQFIYIINELGNTISSAKKVNGRFYPLENVSTLNDQFKDDSFCADIHLSKNETFLYGSNRGENSIVVFKRDILTGKLEKIQNIGTQGNWPRNFALDPSGKFLLVANQKSNNISVFKIDKVSGKLSFMHSTNLPSPVCLLF